MGTTQPTTAADDPALMASIAARDEKALAVIYDRYSGVVFALCLRALPREAAEEVVVDVFWELWDRADRYDPSRGSPILYLMGMTRSRILDKLRATKTRKRQIGQAALDEQSIDVAASQPPAQILLAEEREQVNAALSQLPAEQRKLVEMAFYDAMSHSEIAEQVGEPLGTVKSRIRQGLIRLRNLLLEPGSQARIESKADERTY